jgi:hypothetical protein
VTELSATNVVTLRPTPAGRQTDRLAALVIAEVADAVERLVRSAAVHECVAPAAALHIRALAARIAGVALDAICTWPQT